MNILIGPCLKFCPRTFKLILLLLDLNHSTTLTLHCFNLKDDISNKYYSELLRLNLASKIIIIDSESPVQLDNIDLVFASSHLFDAHFTYTYLKQLLGSKKIPIIYESYDWLNGWCELDDKPLLTSNSMSDNVYLHLKSEKAIASLSDVILVRDIRPVNSLRNLTRSFDTIYLPDSIPKSLQLFSQSLIEKSQQDTIPKACIVYIGNIVPEYFSEIAESYSSSQFDLYVNPDFDFKTNKSKVNHPSLGYLDMLSVLRHLRNSYQYCFGLAIDAGFIPSQYLTNYPKIYKDEISRYSSKNKLSDYIVSDFIPILGVESFSSFQMFHHFQGIPYSLTSEYEPSKLLQQLDAIVNTYLSSPKLLPSINISNYSNYSLSKLKLSILNAFNSKHIAMPSQL